MVCLHRGKVTIVSPLMSNQLISVSVTEHPGLTNTMSLMLIALKKSLNKLALGVFSSAKRLDTTTETRDDESDESTGLQKFPSKKTYKMNKVYPNY